MKNLFFVVLSFAFFLTSCTKDFVEPTIIGTAPDTNSVSNRSESIEINCSVASYEIIIEETILALTEFDSNPSELEIAPLQVIKFIDPSNVNPPVFINFNVNVFEIIIEETILAMTTSDSTDLAGFIPAPTQTIIFN